MGKKHRPGAFVRLFTIDKTKAIDDSMLDEKVLRIKRSNMVRISG
jgi:hypothetical protein